MPVMSIQYIYMSKHQWNKNFWKWRTSLRKMYLMFDMTCLVLSCLPMWRRWDLRPILQPASRGQSRHLGFTFWEPSCRPSLYTWWRLEAMGNFLWDLKLYLLEIHKERPLSASQVYNKLFLVKGRRIMFPSTSPLSLLS